MITLTTTQISDKIGLSYITTSTLLSNYNKFKRAIGYGKSHYYIIDDVFFENLKEVLNQKILFSHKKFVNYKDIYINVLEWQKQFKKTQLKITKNKHML